MTPFFSPAAAAAFFSLTFADARQRWLTAVEVLVERAGETATQQQSFDHPLRGPDDGTLATDSLRIGSERADRVVVFISGTHGIEGYAGSAIQRFLLDQLSTANNNGLSVANNTALLFVHALNPWGMAWARRCDERGIDLNRNFVDFAQPLPDNPHYLQAQRWLQLDDAEERARGLAQLAQTLGRTQYEQAISGGQYVDSDGPFYGGAEPAFGHQVIEQVIDRFKLSGRDLIVIDLHTGLGPWGYGELICDHPADSPNEACARKLFGAAVAVPAKGTSFSVPKLGLMDYRWHRIMGADSCYLTLEFGSYATDDLFNVVIDDHNLWRKYRNPTQAPAVMAEQRKKMLQHFCPEDPYWRQAVLFKAWQVAHRLLLNGTTSR